MKHAECKIRKRPALQDILEKRFRELGEMPMVTAETIRCVSWVACKSCFRCGKPKRRAELQEMGRVHLYVMASR